MTLEEAKFFDGSCGIYLITNKVNGHCYVGQTSRLFYDRWIEHLYASSCNRGGERHTPLHQAIRKYGINNFDFEVLEYCQREKLNEREQYWVQEKESYNHDNYNQTLGGNNAAVCYAQPN